MSSSFWVNGNFIKMWAAQTVSRLGDHITFLALPLTAVLIFKASPSQMGILRALYSASAVFVGLFAGMLVDRFRRRPVLVGCDVGFTILYVSIPIATSLSILHIEHLYIVQFISGILWFFSEVALRSFIPSLVKQSKLIDANSKLGLTHSLASIVGPSAAGAMVQLLTAPIAMIIDGLSFFISAVLIWRIRNAETKKANVGQPSKSWAEIREGLEVVFHSPILRPLVEALFIQHLFTAVISAIFVLYATNELKLDPFRLGLVFSAYGPGFLVGSIVTRYVTRKYGIGPVMIATALLYGIGFALIPVFKGSSIAITLTLIIAYILIAISLQTSEITSVTLRQVLAPNRVQGRLNGSFRFVILIADLLGALAIIMLGDLISLRVLISAAAVGLFFAFVRLLLVPRLRQLKELPSVSEWQDLRS